MIFVGLAGVMGSWDGARMGSQIAELLAKPIAKPRRSCKMDSSFC